MKSAKKIYQNFGIAFAVWQLIGFILAIVNLGLSGSSNCTGTAYGAMSITISVIILLLSLATLAAGVILFVMKAKKD